MPRLLYGLAVIAIAATACRGEPIKAPTRVSVARPTGSPTIQAPSPTPASPLPTTSASMTVPSPVPSRPPSAPPALLTRPAGNVVQLSGTIRLDASYIVAQGGGNVIAHDGGTLTAGDSSGLVATDGSSLIANDGSSLVEDRGNAVVNNDGTTLIANDGSSVIAHDGGTLISQDGGGIVAQGGGNVIAHDGGTYRLAAIARQHASPAPFHVMDAAASAAGGASASPLDASKLPPGVAVPVGGMVLQAVSLSDGKPLPLGEDGRHHAVTAIATDRQGRYTIFLPSGTSGVVKLVASVGTRSGGRLGYPFLVPADGTQEVLDEDTATVSRYIEEAFASDLGYYVSLDADHLRKDMDRLFGSSAQTKGLGDALYQNILPFTQALAAHHPHATPAEVHAIALQAAHLAMSSPALDLLHVPPAYDPAETDPLLPGIRQQDVGLTAVQVLVDVFRTVRRAVAARLTQQRAAGNAHPEKYFADLPVLQAYETLRASQRPDLPPEHLFQYPYPTDFCLFIERAYLCGDILGSDGLTLDERLRFQAMDGLFEGIPSANVALVPAPLNQLFVQHPTPDLPPALTRFDATDGPSPALPHGIALRLSTATKGLSHALSLALFLSNDSALHTGVMALLSQP